MKAIILVAGYATRMYPLTKDQPKALLPLRGKPVVGYILDQLNRLPQVDHIYMVSNDKFYRHFSEWAQTAPSAIPITVLNDGTLTEDTRRGAIGDMAFAIDETRIDDDVVVIAGDNYFTYDLKEQYDFFLRKKRDTLTACQLTDKKQLQSFAVAVLDGDGKVLSLVEKPQEPPSDTAVYATYFYQKGTLPLIRQYLAEGNNPDAPGYFPQWLCARKEVYAYIIQGECFDIGTIAMYEAMK